MGVQFRFRVGGLDISQMRKGRTDGLMSEVLHGLRREPSDDNI